MRKPSLRRVLLWSASAVALGCVFLAYLQPDMARALATQLWNCF